MSKFVLIAVPMLLFLATSLLLPMALRSLPLGIMSLSVIAIGGVVMAYFISGGIEALCVAARVPHPNSGTLSGLAQGVAIGLSVSLAAGFCFQFIAANQPVWPKLFDQLHLPMLLHVFPAANEEVTFRYGIVHAIKAISGTEYSLLAGSVPFGLLHFLGLLLGNTVKLQQVAGVSLGGLLLSIIYIRYGGLLACVGCHWIWNVLGDQWAKVYGLNAIGSHPGFEGAWTTLAVLTAACGILLILWRFDP